jgi:hypothetical protein
LAFHPYTQVIPQVFNPGGSGPPRGLTRASPCPCVDHPASGLQHATQRPVQARFHYGYPPPVNLATHRNSQAHSSKGTQSLTLLRLVSTRFQVLFHDPSPGHFSPFPHGTSALSVTRKYSGLGGGPPRFTRNFTGSVLLGNTPGRHADFRYRAVTVYGQAFQPAPLPARFVTPCQRGSTDQMVPRPPPRNPCRVSHVTGLASSPFAHHYSGNRGCFLFLRVLRCFTSPRYHRPPYAFRRRRHPITGAGFPHSETPGSQSGCRLPGEYRRLQRPSSAPGAKASTVCP